MLNKNKKAFSLLEVSIVLLVIAVAVAGFLQSTVVIKKVKRSAADAATDSFRAYVTSMDGLLMWLDASAPNSFNGSVDAPADGTTLTQWQDVVADINPLAGRIVFNDVLGDPTYKSDGINGLPAVEFDGNDGLRYYPGIIEAGDDDYTVVAVYKPGAATFGCIFNQGKNSGYNYPAETGSRFCLRSGFANEVDINAYAIDVRYLGNFNIGSNESIIVMRQNERDIIAYDGLTKSSVQSNGDLNLTQGIVEIGSDTYAYEEYQGLISEILVFDRVLLDDEIQTIQDYINGKYGIK